MDSLDQIVDFSAEFRLMMISDYLELALLGILIACVWTIYLYITESALLSLILGACALSVELILYILFNTTSIVLDVEEGSLYYTAIDWSSHLVYSLASLSIITLIFSSALFERREHASANDLAINQ